MAPTPFSTSMRFVFTLRFGLFSQSQPFYARKATESVACLSEWVHLRSQRYPAQNDFLPTTQNLTQKKTEVAPSQKIGLFSDQGPLQIIFGRTTHRWQALVLHLWKNCSLVGYISERLKLTPNSVWLIFSVGRPKTGVNATKAKIGTE